jgi:four helix bundle protein
VSLTHGPRDYKTTGQQDHGLRTIGMRDYTKIEAWKLADDLMLAIYERTRSLPREELYGLTSQLRRAAYSVPANISEGSARNSQRDHLHFLYIARGSLSEAQYFAHLAHRLRYLSADDHAQLASQTKRTFACLHGLIRSVESEAGVLTKAAAALTSALVLCLARFAHGSP